MKFWYAKDYQFISWVKSISAIKFASLHLANLIFLFSEFITYHLVRKSNHPFLVLKGVTEMSFLKRISGNSEEN
jgi:uncharacterized protein with PQ loop repeat